MKGESLAETEAAAVEVRASLTHAGMAGSRESPSCVRMMQGRS